MDGRAPAPVFQCLLQVLDNARAVRRFQLHAVLNHLDLGALMATNTRVTLLRQVAFDFGFCEVVGHHHGKSYERRRVRLCTSQDFGGDGVRRVAPNFLAAAAAIEPRRACIQKLQMIVQLRHRADRGAGRAHRIGLVDRDCRGNSIDAISRRLVHALEKLPRVRRKRLDIATLAFGVRRVERKRGFAGAGNPGNDDEFVQRQLEIEALQIVLAGAFDDDTVVRHFNLPRRARDYTESRLVNPVCAANAASPVLYSRSMAEHRGPGFVK